MLNREVSQRRKLEALMGYDPDEADPTLLDRLVADGRNFGTDAANEIAADNRRTRELTSERFVEAAAQGFNSSPRDAVHLRSDGIPLRQEAAAWKRGAYAAQALRGQNLLVTFPRFRTCDFLRWLECEKKFLTDRAGFQTSHLR